MRSKMMNRVIVGLLAVFMGFMAESAKAAALVPVRGFQVQEDLPVSSLIAAIELQLSHWKQFPPHHVLEFGRLQVKAKDYARALNTLVINMKKAPAPEQAVRILTEQCQFFSAGSSLMTSYFEPVYSGSLQKEGVYTQPLYRLPPQKNLRSLTRAQIDGDRLLEGKDLELAWLHPVDAFFLQVQGSGRVQVNQQELMLGYSGTNEQPYVSVGKKLKEILPPEQQNGIGVDTYLRSLSEADRNAILFTNPRYVFFSTVKSPAPTSLGVSATAGRTIASDARLYPKGALALIINHKPKWGKDGSFQGTEPFSRFVLDQDIGGAIQGPGRIDLFWGTGPDAWKNAALVKNEGQLYYLLPLSLLQ